MLGWAMIAPLGRETPNEKERTRTELYRTRTEFSL